MELVEKYVVKKNQQQNLFQTIEYIVSLPLFWPQHLASPPYSPLQNKACTGRSKEKKILLIVNCERQIQFVFSVHEP